MEKAAIQPDLGRFLHVTCARESVDASLIPDFFLAGPNRTGSTWLHRQLCRHPELHFGNPKEIYYFSSLALPKHPLHKSDDLNWYLEHFRITDEVRSSRVRQCMADFACDFTPKRQGEASASYAVGINTTRAHDAIVMNPDLRVVIVARHPVERAWSHIKFDARLAGLDTSTMSADDFRRVLHKNGYILRCGFYSRIHEFWTRRLKPGHLLMTPFDRVTAEPVHMLQDIARFLGVDDDARFFAQASMEGRNETAAVDIPEQIEAELYAHYREEIEKICSTYPIVWSKEPASR